MLALTTDQISSQYLFPFPSYDLCKFINWMCVEDPFSQIRSLYGMHYLFMHQARLQAADFSARRLPIRDIKCLFLSEGLGTLQ